MKVPAPPSGRTLEVRPHFRTFPLGVSVVALVWAAQPGTPGRAAGATAAERAAIARAARGHGRAIQANAPWLSFYGSAKQMGDLEQVAATFRLINIDADPDTGNFTPEQIRILRAGGRNTVLSYLNLGSCERPRRYFRRAPSGLVPCSANRAARLGVYRGFPD